MTYYMKQYKTESHEVQRDKEGQRDGGGPPGWMQMSAVQTPVSHLFTYIPSTVNGERQLSLRDDSYHLK